MNRNFIETKIKEHLDVLDKIIEDNTNDGRVDPAILTLFNTRAICLLVLAVISKE